jgi:hypothetical protein
MGSVRFAVNPKEMAIFHRCLSSKLCVRIFNVLLAEGKLNISAISRKAGCTNNDGIKHLRSMAELGIVKEDFYAGLHMFTLKEGGFTELMKETVGILKAERCCRKLAVKS